MTERGILSVLATKINNNFSEIYTKLGGDSTALTTKISFGDGNVTFEGATADSHETTLIFTDPTADRQIVFPNASGNVLLDSSTNTLTNKTLTSPGLTTPQINDICRPPVCCCSIRQTEQSHYLY